MRLRLQPFLLLCGVLLCTFWPCAQAGKGDHEYDDGEHVVLWVNKVGPKNNPQETYNYFYLPYCKPEPGKPEVYAFAGLGEALQGNELVDSQIDIGFKRPALQPEYVCTSTLTEEQAHLFQEAVFHNYYYELFLDDLPIWGYVGEAQKTAEGKQKALVFTHRRFDISFNGKTIIHVNLTSENPTEVLPGAKLTFTLEVHWHETSTPFSQRFNRYLDYSFFEHKIHWFSIVNSFACAFCLVGLVAVILARTLRKDYARYASLGGDIEAIDTELSDESGWKPLHGDVGRPPDSLVLFSACIGTGVQLTLLTVFVVTLTIMSSLFVKRGSILTVFVVMYALTSVVGGFVSGSYFARCGGKHWVPVFLATALLFPCIVFAIASVLNTVALFYRSLAAMPFGYIVLVLVLWAFISFPLCFIGTLCGRRYNGVSDFPCRVKRIPSPIPERPWYLQPAVITMAGGLLPFGSIFIEMYFIFTSFWNYKVYYVYGFMLLVILLLIMVTGCVSVVGTYFILNSENWKWQWTSFNMAASSSIYAFLYATHFFFHSTKMSGFFQTSFYFGYTTAFCLGLALICGASGFLAANTFVKRIYRNVKCD